jgi:hypothetical protein
MIRIRTAITGLSHCVQCQKTIAQGTQYRWHEGQARHLRCAAAIEINGVPTPAGEAAALRRALRERGA